MSCFDKEFIELGNDWIVCALFFYILLDVNWGKVMFIWG